MGEIGSPGRFTWSVSHRSEFRSEPTEGMGVGMGGAGCLELGECRTPSAHQGAFLGALVMDCIWCESM